MKSDIQFFQQLTRKDLFPAVQKFLAHVEHEVYLGRLGKVFVSYEDFIDKQRKQRQKDLEKKEKERVKQMGQMDDSDIYFLMPPINVDMMV